MQIVELWIKNFGKFADKKIRFSEGIQLVYGENESGKSTLHTFIKGMLFGIVRKRGRAGAGDTFTVYEPWENPNYYAGIMRFVCGGKTFCIQRDFDKVSRRVRLFCEEDGEELSVEKGDLEALLDGLTETSYENTVSVGQLKVETDKSLAEELRDYATNCYALGGGEMDLTGALAHLKDRKKSVEKEIKNALDEKQKRRESTEQEASYVWRDIHKLQEEQASLAEEIAIREAREERKKQDAQTENKGVIDEIRPDKWRIHPLEILAFLAVVVIPVFVIPRPWNYLVSIILFLCCGIYVWNRMKVGKKPVKTEPEILLEEITPEEEKASLAKLLWEQERVSEELKDRNIQYENLQEQMEELVEVSDTVKELEKTRQSAELAIQKIEELSARMQKQMAEQVNGRVSEIIKSITGGKYTRLVIEDQLKISLISEGRKIELTQVSRGTLEQIYFALRMTVAELFYNEELPVILDDTFAYYDDIRLANTLRWLAENKKQVLIFTCHRREAQALDKLGIPYGEHIL